VGCASWGFDKCVSSAPHLPCTLKFFMNICNHQSITKCIHQLGVQCLYSTSTLKLCSDVYNCAARGKYWNRQLTLNDFIVLIKCSSYPNWIVTCVWLYVYYNVNYTPITAYRCEKILYFSIEPNLYYHYSESFYNLDP